MGVGLEASLAIDALAEDLTALLDQADEAAKRGDASALSGALVGLAERLLPIRPFVPDVDLPPAWRDLLRAWLSGADVAVIGLDNMRVLEDAFVYRLVWAIEAVRMRRRANGGESEFMEGSAAAALETGLPQTMMAMLVRTGLPSRIAAMTVITQTQPSFTNATEMNHWLRSDEMAAWTDRPNWPTVGTADLWKRYRTEALARLVPKWSLQEWTMNAAIAQQVDPAIPGRINVDSLTGQISVTTADYRHIVGIQQRLQQLAPSLLHVEFAADRQSARIVRLGRGRAKWELPT